jgi:hypothetical protein
MLAKPLVASGLFFTTLGTTRPLVMPPLVSYANVRDLVRNTPTLKVIHEPANWGIPEGERIDFFTVPTESLDFQTIENPSKKHK